MAGPDRRRQVLAAGGDRAEEPRRAGHLHRLRRRPEGFSRGNRDGVPARHRAAVHRAHGAAQPELRFVETAGGSGRRPSPHLHRRDRRRSRAAADRVRDQVGRRVPADRPVLAAQLAAPDPVLRLSGRDPQGDLHHQRDRVGEHESAQADQEPRCVPER